MAIPERELDHYHLPARIRAGRAPEDGFSCRLALADRIAGLPGVQTVEEGSGTLPCRVEVFLRATARSARREHEAFLLCTIGLDGIGIYGLNEWDRHQVLRGGWGKLHRDHVHMYLPRNYEELEVCWSILQRAYRYLSDVSAQGRPARKALPWDLPRFSRTALQ